MEHTYFIQDLSRKTCPKILQSLWFWEKRLQKFLFFYFFCLENRATPQTKNDVYVPLNRAEVTTICRRLYREKCSYTPFTFDSPLFRSEKMILPTKIFTCELRIDPSAIDWCRRTSPRSPNTRGKTSDKWIRYQLLTQRRSNEINTSDSVQPTGVDALWNLKPCFSLKVHAVDGGCSSVIEVKAAVGALIVGFERNEVENYI